MTSLSGRLSSGARISSEAVPAVIEQPYAYRRTELVEPDWRRLPGWAEVTAEEWAVGRSGSARTA